MSNTNNGPENTNKPGKAVPASGVTYYLKVDGAVVTSDAATIKVCEILKLVGLNADTHLLIKIVNQHRETLPPDAVVDLKNYGVEEFATEKRLVEIFFKNDSFKVPPGEIRVAELKKIFGLPQACHLAVLAGDEIKPLPDNGTIHIRGGEHFASYPCDGKAS